MTPEEYTRLPYHITLVPSPDEGGHTGWVAEVSELPGCYSQGQAPDEAVSRVYDAMLGWISVAQEDGRAIPLPDEEPKYSGRFVVRVPRSLHADLAAAAGREGVSLNAFVSAALAGAVSWRSDTGTSGAITRETVPA